MARPNRQSRRRQPAPPPGTAAMQPPGQPTIPIVGTTTTSTLPVAGPPAPQPPPPSYATTTLPTIPPSTMEPRATTTTLPRSTTPPASTLPPSSAPTTVAGRGTATTIPTDREQVTPTQRAQIAAALTDEITRAVYDVELDPRFVYSSAPLGFESASRKMTERVQIPAIDPTTGEPIPGQYEFARDVATNELLVSTFYVLDPRYMPEDPFVAASRVVAREVMQGVGAGDQFAFLGTEAGRNLAALAGRPQNFMLATAESVQNDLLSMDLNEVNNVKYGLYKTGLIGADDIGDPTSKTISPTVLKKAQEAATYANFNGMDWKQYLNTKSQTGSLLGSLDPSRGTNGGGAPQIQIRLTSRDDLKFVINETAARSLGRSLQNEEIENIVDAIHAEERRYQTQVATQPVVTQATDPRVMAQTMIGEQFETEADVYRMGSTLDSFLRVTGAAS